MPLFRTLLERLSGRDKITQNCRQLVKALSRYIGERSLAQYSNLERTRQFIHTALTLHGSTPRSIPYMVNGRHVENIAVDLPGRSYPENKIVVGAHYDTVEGTLGANDNASGIAALLEIHRLLKNEKLGRTVTLLAFVLEEPPFFDTEQMGSYICAEESRRKNEKIDLMIALDMLGCGGRFVKQNYPVEDMSRKYPRSGNFLACTAVPSDAHYALLARKHFNRHSFTRMREIIAPASVNGVVNSDHISYHKHGYNAILFTDTGYYRNRAYHTEDDSFESINYRFLGDNVYAIARTVKDLANLPPVHFRKKRERHH